MRKWTKAQLDAIGALTGDVLVSASAGSGKTSVMIERLVRLVVEEGIDVENILCLTFTRSAAEEMKGRLKEALIARAQSAVGEERQRIIENLDKLPFADVTTIDAFCGKITKKYFENTDGGVNPTLASEGEVSALKYASAVKVLNDYGDSGDEVYYTLLSFLGKKRGEESFVKLVIGLGEYLETIPNPQLYLDEAIEKYVEDVGQSIVAKQAFLNLLEEAKRIEVMTVPLLKWGLPYPEEVREKMLKIAEHKEGDFTDVYQLLDAPYPEKPRYNRRPYTSYKDSQTPFLELHAVVSNFENKWAKMRVETFSKDTKEAKKYVGKLAEVMKDYMAEYSRRLKENNLTDFSTIAHEALRLLSIKEIRDEIKSNYSHVLIDEYQDTNPLQEEILTSSGGDGSTFVVGDEKQSIYAFRHAEPEIFKDRRSRQSVQVYELTDNFRQDGRIIDVVNGVFTAVMREDWSGIDYKKERMSAGVDYPSDGKPAVEILVLNNTKKREDRDPLPDVYSVKEGEKDIDESVSQEATYVVQTIKNLVGKEKIFDAKLKLFRPITYKDIVVISRNRSKAVKKIVEKLRSSNVPVGVKERAKLPNSAEILVNYLRLINNPTLDDALVISMLSPLFNFDEDSLARYKIASEGKNLWECFRKSAESDEKLKQFYIETEGYIEEAKYLSVHDLVDKIITKRNYLLSLADKGGEESRALLAYVDGLGGDKTAKSVSEYLTYFDQYPEFSTDCDTGGGDAVQFMTMHGAKGLEFPVVFLVETGKKFFDEDKKEAINYHKKWGIGIQTFTPKDRLKRDNFVYKAIKDRKREEQAIEEMRLLYVAMTRAKNLLYISGVLTKEGKVNKDERLVNSHLGFIQTAINKNPDLNNLIRFVEVTEEEEIREEEKGTRTVDLSFVYPNQRAVETPIKYTVTGLIDSDEYSYSLTKAETAEVGTIYHKVMQHIPFNLNKDDLESALDKLVIDEILTREEREEVREEIIERVLSLPVMKRAKDCECLREQQFLLHVKHSELIDGGIDDEVVLQGVIDLLILGDKPIVVDYKYSGKDKEALKETYQKQLKLYARAVKDVLEVDEVDVYLISLKTAECITI